MRKAALVVVFIPAVAAANPLNWSGTPDVVHGAKWPAGVTASTPAPVAPAITHASHTLFLNDCLPDGCNVGPGFDDSRMDRSSIPWQQSHLDAYGWGDSHWNQLVQCVRDTFAPFDIDVVTEDPGQTNHFEVMIGGNDFQIGIDGALGVAPFIPCGGQIDDNVITFVFAAETNDLDELCWAVAQEASHAWGLDHELNANDPMTYLYPPLHKSFQDAAADCGESLDNPRECWCGGPKQNSYQYLMDTFGPSSPVPPTVAITSPADGAWVTPGFRLTATADSQLSLDQFDLAADGTVVGTGTTDTMTFSTPASLAGGDHHLEVTARDSLGQTATAAIDVHVTATCEAGGDACADGFACLGGNCLPDATTAGGLGAVCAGDESCITGQCWSSGDTSLCSMECDAGRTCPDGFDCIGDDPGACWPAAPGSDGGGCAAGGSGDSGGGLPLALGALGVVVAWSRRRRR